MKNIKITQIKSIINRTNTQKLTMKALGLNRINKSVSLIINKSIIGMIKRVNHLIKIEIINK